MPVVNSDCFLRRKIDKILISGLLKVAIQGTLTFQNSPLSISKLKYSTTTKMQRFFYFFIIILKIVNEALFCDKRFYELIITLSQRESFSSSYHFRRKLGLNTILRFDFAQNFQKFQLIVSKIRLKNLEKIPSAKF